jgi:hypothetical protein
MSNQSPSEFESESGETPLRRGQLSSNAHWLFGSLYAALTLIGFSFGVWAGAAKPKPTEVADAKQKENTEKPPERPKPPEPKPKEAEPKAKETEPKPKEPEPKAKEPEPKPKEPEPKPKPKEPEPKKVDFKAVSYKEVQPILRTYCYECHGASAGKPKGNVDVTSIAKMLKSKGDPLVPGKPNDSTLYTTIKSGDMPPDGKKGPSEQELKLIHDWIASGAKERRRPVRTRGLRTNTCRRVALTRPPGAG